jgi:hypothetical protein
MAEDKPIAGLGANGKEKRLNMGRRRSIALPILKGGAVLRRRPDIGEGIGSQSLLSDLAKKT